MRIRDTDVLLPTMIVNSLPRPIFMEGRVFTEGADAREYPSFRLRELYWAAVRLAVADQVDAGLDVVADGGQYYENETNYEVAEHRHVMAQRLENYVPYGDRMVAGTFDLPIYKPTASGRSAGTARCSPRSSRPCARPPIGRSTAHGHRARHAGRDHHRQVLRR